MCACSHDFTCGRCAGTPFDSRYFLDEPGEITPEQFEDLTLERQRPEPIMFGGA